MDVLKVFDRCPGDIWSLSRTPIKYLEDTDQISPGHRSNITRTAIKYLQDTIQISPGH